MPPFRPRLEPDEDTEAAREIERGYADNEDYDDDSPFGSSEGSDRGGPFDGGF